MNDRDLFADVRRHLSSYGLDGSYREAVAFVSGCGAGNDWGLLIGFPEWLATRLNCEANLTWSALMLGAAKVSPDNADSDSEVDKPANVHAVATLFALLDEFLADRSGGRGPSTIIAKCINSRRHSSPLGARLEQALVV